jgi:cytochrome c oxidase subunit 2
MHIHRFERFWIGVSLFAIAIFIGTVVVGFTVYDLRVIGSEKTVDPQNLQETKFANPGIHKAESDTDVAYEVYVVSRQFTFVPGTAKPIVVPADTKIRFHITSPDVLHGFEVVGTNLNTMVIPGQVASFTTKFDENKTYGLLCNEYCGAAHHVMEGLLKVIPKSEFKEKNLVQ